MNLVRLACEDAVSPDKKPCWAHEKVSGLQIRVCNYFIFTSQPKHMFWVLKVSKEKKDQEPLQSSTTPAPGHHMGK